MIKERENAKIIRAWADGYDVEFCFINPQFHERYIKWTTDCQIRVGDPRYTWRIKPTIMSYRVALYGDGESVWIEAHQHEDETRQQFIKWITDWKEVEIDDI